MKTIKYIILLFFINSILYLAFYKNDKINIEGTWFPEKIILEGNLIYPLKIDSLYIGVYRTEILVNEWTDSLYIINGRNKIGISYIIKKNINGNHLINLSSNEKSLNGDFKLKVDTLFFDAVRYQIRVNIESDSTLLYFKRNLQIKPWKPQRPWRGCV